MSCSERSGLPPIGGMAIAIFVGWRMVPAARDRSMADLPPAMVTIWLWSIRVVAPIAVLVVMITAITNALGVDLLQ